MPVLATAHGIPFERIADVAGFTGLGSSGSVRLLIAHAVWRSGSAGAEEPSERPAKQSPEAVRGAAGACRCDEQGPERACPRLRQEGDAAVESCPAGITLILRALAPPFE
jgi:hypothetical protein